LKQHKIILLVAAFTTLAMLGANDLLKPIWADRTMLIYQDKLGTAHLFDARPFLGSNAYSADVIGAGLIGLLVSIIYMQIRQLRLNRNWWANVKFTLLVLFIATAQYQGGVTAATIVAFGFPGCALIFRQMAARVVSRESAMTQLFCGMARIFGSLLIALPFGIGITAGLTLGPAFAVPMIGLAIFSIKMIGRLAFFIRNVSRHSKWLNCRQKARQYSTNKLVVA
jgi:hypothetical protein